MSIAVQCAKCGGSFQVADKYAGAKIRCPKCKVAVIQIAAAAATPVNDPLGGSEDLFASTPTLGPSPKRRGSAVNQRTMRTLMMVGGGLLAVIVLIGGIVIAGSYAWDVASQSGALRDAPSAEGPTAMMPQGRPGPAGPNASPTGPTQVAADPAATDPIQNQTFHPENYPIELNFPAGPIVREQVAGLEQFRWQVPAGYDVSQGVFTEVKLIVVPRVEGESDLAAIETAKRRVRPLPPDESQIRNARVGNTTVAGRPGYAVMFEAPSQRTRNFGAYFIDPDHVYILLAVADANIPPHEWMEMVHSIRFDEIVASVTPVEPEPPKVATAPKPKMPDTPKPTRETSSILDTPVNAAEVAAFWRGGVKMRSSLHPFEIEYPSNRVIAFPNSPDSDGKMTAVQYLHRLDAGLIDGRLILDGDLTRFFATVINVIVSPRTDGKDDETLIQALRDSAKQGRSQGVLSEARETQHEGFPAVDMANAIESGIAGRVVFERARVIIRPDAVYMILARGKTANTAGARLINSFHFLDQPGQAGDGSQLIPVADFSGAQPTMRNLSGQADPSGRYVRWEEIPLQKP